MAHSGYSRLTGLVDEYQRLKKKIEIAREHGAHDATIAELEEQLKAARMLVAEAAAKEFYREVEALQHDVEKLGSGEPPSGGNHPGNQGNEQTPQGAAAEATAAAAAAAAAVIAKRLAEDSPGADNPPASGDGPDGGNGHGGTTPGEGHGDGGCDCCCAAAAAALAIAASSSNAGAIAIAAGGAGGAGAGGAGGAAGIGIGGAGGSVIGSTSSRPSSGSAANPTPPPTRVFVRSGQTVWCWSRPQQQWVPFSDGTPIVEVQLVPAGILIVAQRSAVLFDCHLGRYLPVLTANEQLVDGGGDS